MKVVLRPAARSDATAIAALRATVAKRLTLDYGKGPWSSPATEKGVLYAMRISNAFVAWRRKKIIGVAELGINKPWAIDKSYFSRCNRVLYLTGMAVAPEFQRRGIGRAMLEAAHGLWRQSGWMHTTRWRARMTFTLNAAIGKWAVSDIMNRR